MQSYVTQSYLLGKYGKDISNSLNFFVNEKGDLSLLTKKIYPRIFPPEVQNLIAHYTITKTAHRFFDTYKWRNKPYLTREIPTLFLKGLTYNTHNGMIAWVNNDGLTVAYQPKKDPSTPYQYVLCNVNRCIPIACHPNKLITESINIPNYNHTSCSTFIQQNPENGDITLALLKRTPPYKGDIWNISKKERMYSIPSFVAQPLDVSRYDNTTILIALYNGDIIKHSVANHSSSYVVQKDILTPHSLLYIPEKQTLFVGTRHGGLSHFSGPQLTHDITQKKERGGFTLGLCNIPESNLIVSGGLNNYTCIRDEKNLTLYKIIPKKDCTGIHYEHDTLIITSKKGDTGISFEFQCFNQKETAALTKVLYKLTIAQALLLQKMMLSKLENNNQPYQYTPEENSLFTSLPDDVQELVNRFNLCKKKNLKRKKEFTYDNRKKRYKKIKQ